MLIRNSNRERNTREDWLKNDASQGRTENVIWSNWSASYTPFTVTIRPRTISTIKSFKQITFKHWFFVRCKQSVDPQCIPLSWAENDSGNTASTPGLSSWKDDGSDSQLMVRWCVKRCCYAIPKVTIGKCVCCGSDWQPLACESMQRLSKWKRLTFGCFSK